MLRYFYHKLKFVMKFNIYYFIQLEKLLEITLTYTNFRPIVN